MTVPKRRWFRFSLATLFIVVTVISCLAGYGVNWIHQRRDLVHEGDILVQKSSNYVTGVTSDELPPAGSTLSQRLLTFLGEPPTNRCFVWILLREEELEEIEPVDVPKVRRARELLPEAEIVVVWFQPDAFLPDELDEIIHIISP
jgi:hypothetical protein